MAEITETNEAIIYLFYYIWKKKNCHVAEQILL